jgi:hypothetical protein
VKKFLLVVTLSVGSGLALRYALHRHDKSPATPAAEPRVAVPMPEPEPAPPPVAPPPVPTPVPPPAPPEPPPPPRIAGATQVSDAIVQHFAAAPGVIYYCEGASVMAQPKAGGAPKVVGECGNAFDFHADAQGVFYCSNSQLMRITAGTDGNHVVVDNVDCIVSALDAKYVYYVVPGFDDAPNFGVYRVARAGGTPEKLVATSPKEQYLLAVDDDALWVGGWGFGTIAKLVKTPNAKAKTLVTDQKGIVSLAVTPTHLYWYAENTGEVRRRKKTGGRIEVVGHDIDQEPVLAVDGHVYWFEGKPGEDKRLVHLAPSMAKPETLASGLHTPSLQVDSEGEYVTELDRPGIFMLKR